MNDIEKLVNEEMMRVDDEQIKNFAHIMGIMYKNLIIEGFTKQQAMELVKTMLRPKIGG